jgi:bifunctional non-homologous end joining protein LigD
MPSVRLSHPDKVLFPRDGITKADLADYYAAVAEAMLPHVRDRPLALWRYNAGIEAGQVVQQEIPKGAPEWVKRVQVPRRRGGTVCHALCNDAATLRWLANLNCVTPHVWAARADRLERPDRVLFDLDPIADGQFDAIRRAALALGSLLRELGLEPFAKLSGSRGIHVVFAIRRTAGTDLVRERAATIAQELADRHPDELTTAWRKESRGGRILVDTARNTFAQTTVAAYAVRARHGAPVSAPLRWEELEDPCLRPDAWTVRTLPARLEREGDPWAELGRRAPALPL